MGNADAKLQAPHKSTSTIVRRWIAQELLLLKLADDILLHTSSKENGGFPFDDDSRMPSAEPLLHLSNINLNELNPQVG